MWRRAWWLLVGVLLGIMAVSASAFAQTPWGFGGTAQMLPWGTGAGNTTELRFYELVAGGANYRGLKAPDALTGNIVWTLPATDTAGCLQSDGAGALSITSCPGGGDVTASGTLTLNQLILGAGTTTVKALGDLGTTTTVYHGNAAGAGSFGKVAFATDVSGTLAEANFPALNGDGTTPSGSLTLTLANSGVSAGTCGQVVVDAKGRATTCTTVADVAHGGTGAATFTIHGVLLGNTASAFGVTAEGATGTVLGGVTGANPAFTATPAVTSVTTSGQGAIVIGPYGVGVGNTGELRLLELAANGTNYRGFKAPDALTGDLIWTLPTADGAGGECLATDGSGTLSWGACSAGSGTGITSLGGLNAAIQTFVNDTNVTMVSASSTHTITWAGLLGVTRGGTGAATLTSHGVLFGAGTGAVTASAEGATGTVLQGATGGNAAFTATPTVTTLNMTGNPSLSLGPWGAATGNTGTIRFLELAANGTNYVALRAADSVASNVTWTLPAADGAPLQCVTTTGSGVLQFSNCSGGAAPADPTYVTLSLNGSLSNERVLTAGSGIGLLDGGANSTVTISATGAAIATSTFAGLPAASGAWGPVRLVTTATGPNPKGLFVDVPTAGWVPTNRTCNVQMWGAVSNSVWARDAVMTVSSGVLTSATAHFTAADVGKTIQVGGAGSDAGPPETQIYVPLVTTISVFTSATQVTLAASAARSITDKVLYVYGTNNDTVIRTALAAGCRDVLLPAGTYWAVAGNALPTPAYGMYTIKGEDGSSLIGCAAGPPCTGAQISQPTNTTLANLSVDDLFTVAFNGSGPRYCIYGANFSAVVEPTTACSWDGQWNLSIGGYGRIEHTDTPGINIINYGGGGNLYAACRSTATGGCNGIDYAYASPHAGQAHRVSMELTAGGGSTGFQMSDETTSAGVFFSQYETTSRTSGVLVSFRQEASTYTGDILEFRMAQNFRGVSPGTFTGTFARFYNAGALKLQISSTGQVTSAPLVSAGTSTTCADTNGTLAMCQDLLTVVTATKTVRNAAGSGTCTLEYTQGLLTGGTC